MEIFEKLTQQKLQEILINTYLRGIEAENINVKEIIEEIIQQVMAAEID